MRFDGGIRQVATPLILEDLVPLQEHCHTIQFSERLTDEPWNYDVHKARAARRSLVS